MRRPAAPSRRSAAGAGRPGSLAGEPHRGDLLEEDRIENLARDRPGDLAPLTAPLGDHHHHDLGRLRRGERRKPRVVLALLGLRLGDHLRGARLARDVDSGNARRRAGSIVVHHRPEALPQERPHDRRQLDVAVDLSLVAPDDAAIGPLDPLHEARSPEDAAVGDRRHEARDLHRRDEHGALPDRHVDRLADRERLALTPARRLGLRQEAELLPREVDGGRLTEPEGARIADDGGAADLETGHVEEDVAGVLDRAAEIAGPVPAFLPVLEDGAAQLELAGAVRPVKRRDRALLKAGRRHDDLEHGARRVLRLDGTVEQRKVRILYHTQPGFAIDGPGEAVDLEGRRGHHREHIAVARIHDDDGAGLALHRALGRLLDPTVDRRDDLGAGVRLGLLHPANRASHRVDLDALAAVLAAQMLVEKPLESGLAHHFAATVATLLELLVARLARSEERHVGKERGYRWWPYHLT